MRIDIIISGQKNKISIYFTEFFFFWCIFHLKNEIMCICVYSIIPDVSNGYIGYILIIGWCLGVFVTSCEIWHWDKTNLLHEMKYIFLSYHYCTFDWVNELCGELTAERSAVQTSFVDCRFQQEKEQLWCHGGPDAQMIWLGTCSQSRSSHTPHAHRHTHKERESKIFISVKECVVLE